MKYLYIALPVFLVLAASCEKIIDIDLPDNQKKIVVNSLINPDSLVTVNLTRSLSVLEPDSFVFLNEANIWLSHNDQKIGSLIFNGSGNYTLPGFYPQEGENYRLDVEYPGLEPVYANTNVPSRIEIKSLDTSSYYDEWNNKELRLDIRFDDPSDEENHYALVMYATTKKYDYLTGELLDEKETNPVYFDWREPMDNQPAADFGDRINFGGKILFDDRLFNGRERIIDVSVFSYNFYMADTILLEVKLEQVEKSYFLYALSSEKYYNSYRNPFSEPVQVYNNIEGGFGIFSGYASDSKSLVLLGENGK